MIGRTASMSVRLYRQIVRIEFEENVPGVRVSAGWMSVVLNEDDLEAVALAVLRVRDQREQWAAAPEVMK